MKIMSKTGGRYSRKFLAPARRRRHFSVESVKGVPFTLEWCLSCIYNIIRFGGYTQYAPKSSTKGSLPIIISPPAGYVKQFRTPSLLLLSLAFPLSQLGRRRRRAVSTAGDGDMELFKLLFSLNYQSHHRLLHPHRPLPSGCLVVESHTLPAYN